MKMARCTASAAREIRVLTVEDARRLVRVIRSDRFEALWTFALTLGMRKGELLGLHCSGVDFSNGTVAVRYALQGVSGRPVLAEPKTALSPCGARLRVTVSRWLHY